MCILVTHLRKLFDKVRDGDSVAIGMLFSVSVFFILLLIDVFADLDGLLGDIVVEAHGLFFDLLVFGLLLVLLQLRRDGLATLNRYYEELRDYAAWDLPEGIYRKEGLIRRIYEQAAASKKDVVLEEISLNGIDLSYRCLDGVTIDKCTCEGANLSGSSLRHSQLRWGYSKRSVAPWVEKRPIFSGVDFTGSFVASAYIFNDNEIASVRYADFRGVIWSPPPGDEEVARLVTLRAIVDDRLLDSVELRERNQSNIDERLKRLAQEDQFTKTMELSQKRIELDSIEINRINLAVEEIKNLWKDDR